MFNAREKILKKETTPLEEDVAKTLYNLEMESDGKLKQNLGQLFITGAETIEYKQRNGEAGKAILIRIPFLSLEAYKRSRGPIVKALENRFENTHAIVVANRTIMSKFGKPNLLILQPSSKDQDREL